MQIEDIKKQFEFEANTYDSEIHLIFPKYKEMCETIVSKLPYKKNDKFKILDLGIGTGYLAEHIIKKFPNVKIIGIDISKNMMSLAKRRLDNYQHNTKFFISSIQYFSFVEKFDLVLGTLSIHHLTKEEKQSLYNKVHSHLKPKGLFIIGDMIKGNTKALNEKLYRNFKSQIIKSYGREQGTKNYNLWHKEDIPESINDTISMLKQSKFKLPKSIWTKDNLAIIISNK